MKATINNIMVEGTPQEIMEYQRLMDIKNEQTLRKPINPYQTSDKSWWYKLNPQITCDSILQQNKYGKTYECNGNVQAFYDGWNI